MSVWQFFTALIAAVLAAAWLGLLIRYRLRSVIVVGALGFGLPVFGFALYALSPGPLPADDAVIFLVALVYVATFVAVIFRLFRRRRAKEKPTVYSLAFESRRQVRAFITRSLAVLWLSGLVFLFEPGVAFANLAINCAWIVIWMPRRLRTAGYETSVDISAPIGLVFAFVTDPRNWPRYRDNAELVSVTPDGPLRLGTEYVVRNKIPAPFQRGSQRQLESRSTVIAFEPGNSYTSAIVDLPRNYLHSRFEPTEAGGTRLQVRSELEVSFLEACSGSMLNMPTALASRRAIDTQNFAKLKQILEAVPTQ